MPLLQYYMILYLYCKNGSKSMNFSISIFVSDVTIIVAFLAIALLYEGT
jgi:hypothetical protein